MLFASDNNIESLPKQFGRLKRLHTLHVRRCCYWQPNTQRGLGVPCTMQCLCIPVAWLQLASNELRQLPDSFVEVSFRPSGAGCRLQRLALSVDVSGVAVWAVCVPQLVSLQTLDLSYNLMEALPLKCGTLQALRTLHLQNNTIVNLPDEFARLTSLEVSVEYHAHPPPRSVTTVALMTTPRAAPSTRALAQRPVTRTSRWLCRRTSFCTATALTSLR